jgi:hypothetical protein
MPTTPLARRAPLSPRAGRLVYPKSLSGINHFRNDRLGWITGSRM